MQLWLTLLLCICFLEYRRTDRQRFVVLGALCMCGTVLAYPSCAILFPAAVYFLWKNGLPKNVWLFVAICCMTGAVYTTILVSGVGLEGFSIFLHGMFSLETSHGMS